MPAILKTFRVKISQRQAGQIRSQFIKACKANGADWGAMLIQPKTQFCGASNVALLDPCMECAVVPYDLFKKIQELIRKRRDADALRVQRKKVEYGLAKRPVEIK